MNQHPRNRRPMATYVPVSELPRLHADNVVAVGPTSGLFYVNIARPMARALEDLELKSYPTASAEELYNAGDFEMLATDFPLGNVVGFDVEDPAYPVAAGLGVRVNFDFDHPQHTCDDINDDDPTGPWYYGTDIFVRPEYRRRGIGKEIYDLRKHVCRELNLQGIVAGGVLPGFADHKHTMSADDYIAEVKAGRLYDPTLTFQLENGFDAVCALEDYLTDPKVDNWASLIVWRNPDYVG